MMPASAPATEAQQTALPVVPSARYLVTGGAGFIGSNLVEALVEEGASVRVLDDFSTGTRENLGGFLGAIELVEGSITNPATCESVCEGVDFVLHQAALPSVPRSVADPAASHEACATGTLNMLVAARDAGVRRFVYAGSSSAYGDTPTLPKVENMPALPRSPYAVAKLAGEQYCVAFSLIYDLETVVLRYFNIFGPRQDPASQYSAVIPLFITKALTGKARPSMEMANKRGTSHTWRMPSGPTCWRVPPTRGRCPGRSSTLAVGSGFRSICCGKRSRRPPMPRWSQ